MIELVVVLACICIILAVAVPNFNRFQKQWALWGATRLLESSLHWGRMYAITANTSLTMIIDQEGRRFFWADSGTGAPYESTVRYLPGQVRIIDSPRRSLRFFPHGNAAPAGTFILQGEAGIYRVVVNPVGRVRVQKN